MDQYIKKKLDQTTKREKPIIHENLTEAVSQSNLIRKKVKINEIFVNNLYEQLKNVTSIMEQIKNKINNLESQKDIVVLDQSSCKESLREASIPERIAPITNQISPKSQQLGVVIPVDKKRKSLYRRAPNQVSDEQLSSISNSQKSEQSFVPKP